jgi:hypothetical protein
MIDYQKKPIIQKRRKKVFTVGSKEEAVRVLKVGLTATHVERIKKLVGRNVNLVVEKKVRRVLNIPHVDLHLPHAKLRIKEKNGVRRAKIPYL